MAFSFNNSDIINIKDNETGIAMLDKLSRIKDGRRVEPLDSLDNISYPHRYLYDEYNLQIGDTYFMIPPEFIMVSSESTSQSLVTLRQENTQKIKSGYHKRTILIDLVFNGIEQLNGYPVDGPEGIYYVDGLRQLLAQFKCTPFLPISNELINGMYGIFTVALQSITISTIQGFPNVMTAQITLQEVNMFPYIEMPDVCFKYMIDWDLFRYYYQRLLTENHTYKKLQSLSSNKEHNKFKLSILDSSVFDSKEATKANLLEIICDIKKVSKDKNSNYITWVDSDTSDVVISSFQCGYSNILTNIQLSDISTPTVQFIGGMDTIYNITFETTDYSVVQAIEQCQISNDLLVRNCTKYRSVGFVKLESELVEFTGSLFVMIESVTTNTVPGFPGLYNVQINCIAYDIAQSERENLHGFRPFDCSHEDCNSFEPSYVHSEQGIYQTTEGLRTKIKQDNYAEWKLRTSIEVYPDLHLPTYSEVNKFINKCTEFRAKHKLSPLPYSEYPTNPTCMIHGSHPDNKIKVSFPKYNIDIGGTNIEVPDFILPDSISDTVTFMENVSREGLEYNIYVDPDFYVFYPCSYKSFLSEEEIDKTKEQIENMTQKAMGKYYDYDPKQRSSYTKTRIVTNYPDYSKEGNINNSLVEDFITLAQTFIGCSYVLGAEGEASDSRGKCFDCSGFITYLLKEIGVMPSNQDKFIVSTMPNSDLFTEVSWNQMQRGDILCNADLSRVVIYEGNNRIIHASNSAPYPKGGVKEDDLFFTGGRCLRPKAFINNNIQDDTMEYGSMYSSVEQIKHQDLGVWPSITVDEMNAWIASRANKGSPFIGQGAVFINAGIVTGLDPRYILAHAALESGWGTSRISRDKSNYFGIGAFDSSPYESALTFSSSLERGIVEGAKWIAKNYYHNEEYNQKTLYTMRWNNNQHQYATNPLWDTKIAEIMVGAPSSFGSGFNNNRHVLTQAEFDSICRVIMAETKGEGPETEKAIAQVIYDRLTYSNRKFGGLSNILNSQDQFKAPYKGELNSTIENNVKAVFCNNDKYWPNYKALYFLTPDDTNATFTNRNDNSDKLGEVGKHTFWGIKSKGSDIKYTIVDKNSTGPASDNTQEEIQKVDHNAITLGMENIKKFAEPVLIKTSNMMYDDTNLKGWDNTNASSMSKNHLNSGANIFNTSFCDEYQYSARGRLVRAFPTYLFCILDDNAQWFDGRKLWTNYYIHRSIVDIAIHGTNDMPTETATITVTNSYHNLDRTKGGLTNYSLREDGGYFQWIRDFYKFSGLLLGPVKLTDKIIKLHQIIYDHAKLREGARVHLRMGYGSDPLSLAPVMNGHISDISLGDQITAVVTSDGHELIQHVTSAKEKDANNGFLGLFGLFQNQESSNIIANIMCERASWMHYLTPGFAFEGSKYSIEHFGLYFSQNIYYNQIQHTNKALDTIRDGVDNINNASNYLGFDIPILSNITEFVNSDTAGIISGIISGIFGVNPLFAFNGQTDLINDLFDGYQEQYDILKNIYKSSYIRSHYIYTEVFGNLDGEKNVVFNKYNMTPWDIFQVCTQQVPEYIVKPSYHQFDSRLYFGLPFWMEKFRYDYLNGEVYEECKTSTQVHMLDLTNIIDNQVKVTSKFSNTNVKVMYTRGQSGVSTKTVFSDDTIDFAYQKTTILDTPITQNAFGPDALYEFLGYKVGEESARRVGISNLLYGWQQQYQGQIILMGCSGIKPHDYVLIHDNFANLFGIAIAREVVHSFNINTGFTTSVTLGMIGFCTDENSGMVDTCKNLLMVLNCFSSYIQTRKTLLNNYEQNINLFANFEILRNKMTCAAERSATIRGLMLGQTLLGNAGAAGLGVYNGIKYGKAAFTLAKNFKNIATSIKWIDTFKDGYQAVEASAKIFKVAKGSWGGIKSVYTAIKAGTTAAAGAPTSGIGSIVLLVVWALVDILITEVIEWFSNKNVCMLLPLWWEGYPFVSGVKDGEKILICGSLANGTEENTKGDSIESSDWQNRFD